MTLEHDLLKLARDAMRLLMNGRHFGTGQTGYYLKIISRIEAELSRPKPEQEPVAWMLTLPDGTHDWILDGRDCDGYVPLYTAPTKREWVYLTDDEIENIVDMNTSDCSGYDIFCDGDAVAREVMAKLREKNG
jgi:hypothetical protein